MLLAHEILVIAPAPIILVALAFAASLLLARKIIAEMPQPTLWSSAQNRFLILTGSTLLAKEVVAGEKLLSRAGQILVAPRYITLADKVVDLVLPLHIENMSVFRRNRVSRSVSGEKR